MYVFKFFLDCWILSLHFMSYTSHLNPTTHHSSHKDISEVPLQVEYRRLSDISDLSLASWVLHLSYKCCRPYSKWQHLPYIPSIHGSLTQEPCPVPCPTLEICINVENMVRVCPLTLFMIKCGEQVILNPTFWDTDELYREGSQNLSHFLQ